MSPIQRAAARPAPAARPRPRPSLRDGAPTPEAVAAARRALDANLATPLAPAPADKTAKAQWIKEARARHAALEKHLAVLHDGWFKADLPFEVFTGYSRKLWEFERPIAAAERDLAPPASPAAPAECAPYLTPSLLDAMEKHPNNPLTILGVMFLPITMIVDGANGLSRLGGTCKQPPAGGKPSPAGGKPSPAKPAPAPAKPAPRKPGDPLGPGDFPLPPKDGPRYAARPAARPLG